MLAASKYADAQLLYRKSISEDPKFAEGYYRLGVLEYQLKQGNEALDNLQRAVNFDPGNERYGIELANISFEAYRAMPNRKNLYAQVVQEADRLLKKDPNSFDGLRLKGDVLVLDRNYDDAMSEFRKAYAIKPNNPNIIVAMAAILFAQKQDREGEEFLQRFLNVRKDFPTIYDLLVTHYLRNRRVENAQHILELEIASLPKNANARLQLASLYRASGREQEMSRVLEKIVAERANFPSGPIIVGDFYAAYGKWDDALLHYRAGIEQASDKDLCHKRIASALTAAGKRQEALVELQEILKANPKDAEARLSRTVLWRESKNTKDRDLAMAELKALAAQDPQDAVVHYNLGLSYLAMGDSGSAGAQLQKSSVLRKDYIAPRLVLAELAQSAHNYSAALAAAGEVLAFDPNNFDAQLAKASALVGSKSYRQAASDLNALSQLHPDSKEVTLELAALAAGEKDYAKTERLYRDLYHPGSSDLRPLRGLLALCVLEHHPEKAQALLEGELKQVPDSPAVHLLVASFAIEERKFDVASQEYRWLQSKEPKSAQPYSSLGDLYQLQGVPQEALASYEKAEELAPRDTRILNQIAILESNSGQAKEAIATLNKQLTLDPNNAAAMNNLAFNLAETGTDLDRALALSQVVARKFPNDPGVIDTLGWVYTRRGLNQSGIQVLRALVNKNPNQPIFRYHLAVALLQDKQSSAAKRELLAALSHHPPKELSSRIQENLARVQ
jgi:tetratricopeptide (TPR) repeat protein